MRTPQSPEIPRFHLQRIDVQVGNEDVRGPDALGGVARIGRRWSAVKLVASAMGKREGGVPAADSGELGREVDQSVSDHMDHIALALDPADDAQHRGRQDDAALLFVKGLPVWVCFSGPIARALPARWSVAERMAAATFRLDRWEAGARLMQSADSQGWARGMVVSELERANRKALDDCRKAAVWTGMAQRCTLTVASGSAKASR